MFFTTDELTTTGPSYVASLENDTIKTFEVSPADAGLAEVEPEYLKGGDGEYNASAIRGMLAGDAGPYRDIVLYNAAAALIIAEKAENLRDGVAMAANAIDCGEAAAVLEKLLEITNSNCHPEEENV